MNLRGEIRMKGRWSLLDMILYGLAEFTFGIAMIVAVSKLAQLEYQLIISVLCLIGIILSYKFMSLEYDSNKGVKK